MQLNRDTLRLPARHAARIEARSRLAKTLEQGAHLRATGNRKQADDQDRTGEEAASEEVHDFRVALRRLRSWLRAFHPSLDDTVGRKEMRRLARISKLAGKARDLEVQYGWLRGNETAGNDRDGEAARWLAGRIASEYDRALGRLRKALAEKLPSAGAKLAGQLRHYHLEVDLDAPSAEPTMGTMMARLLREHAEDLERALARIERADQIDEAHRARIAAKRLRYLLETFGERPAPAAHAAQRLAELQDLLGHLHDAHLLAMRLRAEREQKETEGRKGCEHHQRPSRRAFGPLHATARREVVTAFREARQAVKSKGTSDAIAATIKLAKRLES